MKRLWAFGKFKKELKAFSLQTQKILANSAEEEASAISDIREPLAKIFKAGLSKYNEGKTAAGEAMELAARQEILSLERYLGVLGTIGSTASFMGLFDTVIGIIRAFHDLAIAEQIIFGPTN